MTDITVEETRIVMDGAGLRGEPGANGLDGVMSPASQSDVNAGLGADKAVTPPTLRGNQDIARRLGWAIDNQLPSAAKPVIVHYAEANRIVAVVRPPNASYRNGHTRRYDDVVVFEWVQLAGTYHPAGVQMWELCSIWTRFAGVVAPHANFSWSSAPSGNMDTGQQASTNAFAWFYGKTADSEATINAAQGSGFYHGNIATTTAPRFYVNGGVKNGVVIPDGADVFTTFLPGEVITCSQFEMQQTIGCLTPDGTEGMIADLLHRIAPLTGQQLTVATSQPFGAAGYKSTFAYSAMLAQRIANQAQARSTAGVAGPVQTVGLGAGASVDFGQAQRVTTWHTDTPGSCLDIEINPAYAPYRVNGVPAPYTVPATGLDNAAGLKVYFSYFQGSLDSDDVTSKTFTQLVHYNGVKADGA